ncbi:MAG: hypothetical protein L3K02_03785 [Thermoplasmata archaeon]|nr:hypothetical protein [Thermoplasmata archaeon]
MSHREVDGHLSFPNHASHVVRGALVRVVLSVLIPVVWISLTLVYVGFFAAPLSLFQDFVIVLVSLLALVGAITAMWVSFGLGVYHRWADW